jgi:hypothetical protein
MYRKEWAVIVAALGVLLLVCAAIIWTGAANDQRALRARYDALPESEVILAEKIVQAAR